MNEISNDLIHGSREEDRDIYWAARMYYEMGYQQVKISKIMNLSPVAVSRLLKKAEERGIVHFRVIDPGFGPIEKLANEVKEVFKLKNVLLRYGNSDVYAGNKLNEAEEVHKYHQDEQIIKNRGERSGREEENGETREEKEEKKEKWRTGSIKSIREAITDELAEEAAIYLNKILNNRDTLCMAWGKMMRGVVNAIKPTKILPDLKLVPMIGIRGLKPDRLEANNLILETAYVYGSNNYSCIPFPAVIHLSQEMIHAIKKSYLWKQIEDVMDSTTVAISSIAEASTDSMAVLANLIESSDVKYLKNFGAVGEICAWYFNRNGEEVLPKNEQSVYKMGFGLERLRKMVRENKTVIGVAGAIQNRTEPIYAVLKGGIINVLVTDHVTAIELLRKEGRRLPIQKDETKDKDTDMKEIYF